MGIVHMVNIILRMESSLSSMLIFEYLRQESFTVLIDRMTTVSLYRHSSSMYCVELSSNLSLLSSWASLSSLRIGSTLRNRWSLHFHGLRWPSDQILHLIGTWLNH